MDDRMGLMMGGPGYRIKPVIDANSWDDDKVVVELFGE